jgi:hypothetical protein
MGVCKLKNTSAHGLRQGLHGRLVGKRMGAMKPLPQPLWRVFRAFDVFPCYNMISRTRYVRVTVSLAGHAAGQASAQKHVK